MSGTLLFAPGTLALRRPGAAIFTDAPAAPSGGGGPPPTISTVNILGVGQSNAGYFGSVDGALANLAQGAGFYLGAGSTAGFLRWGDNTPYSAKSGYGLYNTLQPSAWFLTYDAAQPPSIWALGVAGSATSDYIASLTTAQRNGIVAIWQYWNESDSLLAYSVKATYKAACVRWLALLRGMLGKTAAQLPVLWSGPPYGVPGGFTMTQEVHAELAADATQNVVLALPQTGDSIWRDATYNAATGAFSGGSDTGHVAATDNITFGKRASLAAARAIATAQGLPAGAISAALGAGTGPRITSARLSGNTVIATITHDGGNDLRVPLLAASGAGFAVMDGGTPGSAPGTIISATACARINATQLQITLAGTPSGSPTSCRLFYPYANDRIGRGDAVTDNFSAVSKPAGFDIGATLGSSWAIDMPLQSPITVTAGVASAGLVLS